MIHYYLLSGALTAQATGAGSSQIITPFPFVDATTVEFVSGVWAVPPTILNISGEIVGQGGPIPGALFGPVGNEWTAEWAVAEGNAFPRPPDGFYTLRVRVTNSQGTDVYDYPFTVGTPPEPSPEVPRGARRIQYIYRGDDNLNWLEQLHSDAAVVLEETPEDQTVVDNAKKELDSLELILLESQLAGLRRAIEQAEVEQARKESKKVLEAARKALRQAKRRLDDEEAMYIL